ncbi:MAG: hypothetical protein WDW36_003421 [Sanguina aurantia]
MDPHRVLGVSRDSSKEELKTAWRKGVLAHHPDRHANGTIGQKEQAAAKFKAITEAYEKLTTGKSPGAHSWTHPSQSASNPRWARHRNPDESFGSQRSTRHYGKSESGSNPFHQQSMNEEWARSWNDPGGPRQRPGTHELHVSGRAAGRPSWREGTPPTLLSTPGEEVCGGRGRRAFRGPWRPRTVFYGVVGGLSAALVLGFSGESVDLAWGAQNKGKSFNDISRHQSSLSAADREHLYLNLGTGQVRDRVRAGGAFQQPYEYGGYAGLLPAKKSTDPDNNLAEMSLSELVKRESAAEAAAEERRTIPPVFSKEAQRRLDLRAQRRKDAAVAAAAAAGGVFVPAEGGDPSGPSAPKPPGPTTTFRVPTPAAAAGSGSSSPDPGSTAPSRGGSSSPNWLTEEEVRVAAAANRERIRARREYVQRGEVIPAPSPPGQMRGGSQPAPSRSEEGGDSTL